MMDHRITIELLRPRLLAAVRRTQVETPAGEAAVVEHRGAYGDLAKAHAALRAWCAASGRAIGAYSLEVYGDWSSDPSKLITTIQYLLG